ncbi:nucleolar protein 16 [Euwallacea fornicatus]|uniref:nucleolar protein 16 n=1 Tax=Euwallacea fornicatus TaxID=995702 RepID=UPI00338F382B
MTKLRKQRRKKVFRHNVNRKRLRNKITNKGNIGCKEVKDAWDSKKSVQVNLATMGLSYDPNQTIGIPKKKRELQETLGFNRNNEDKQEENLRLNIKQYVADMLEADAKAPRVKNLRLPKSQVEWITYLLKKYGTDYRAMAQDSKNYYQETWKQLRQKVRLFRKIPEQFGKFLKENLGQNFDSDNENLYSDGEI